MSQPPRGQKAGTTAHPPLPAERRRATKNGRDLTGSGCPWLDSWLYRFSDRRSVDPPELCDDASSTKRAGCHRGDRRWRRASDRAVCSPLAGIGACVVRRRAGGDRRAASFAITWSDSLGGKSMMTGGIGGILSSTARTGHSAYEGSDLRICISPERVGQGAAQAGMGFDAVENSHVIGIRHTFEAAALEDGPRGRLPASGVALPH
jgi:hypothetical protein